LDWLCTNFAKERNATSVDKHGRIFNIHNSYKTAIAQFKRRDFDPFRRRLRITLKNPNGDIETTIGQVNMLHWCEEHGVLEFAAAHASEIEASVNKATQASRKRKEEAKKRGERAPRYELSHAPRRAATIYRATATTRR
jgi:hypothetical protein